MTSGVYKIEHKATGRMYIGSALNIYNRIRDHKSALRNKKHSNRYLQRVWDKYGSDAFDFSTIIICAANDRVMYEQLCIDGFKSYKKAKGFNLRPTADASGNRGGSQNQKEAIRKKWQDPDYRKKMKVAESGQKFGRLTLVSLDKKTSGSYTWLCQCDCGNQVKTKIGSMRNGDTKSCGCLNSELCKKRGIEKIGKVFKFVNLNGNKTHIRQAEKILGIGINGIARKARVKKISLQDACDYFVKIKVQ